jgi:hypothetical protein
MPAAGHSFAPPPAAIGQVGQLADSVFRMMPWLSTNDAPQSM